MKLVYHIRKKLPLAWMWIGLYLFMCSCSNEMDVYNPVANGDPASVTLTIRTPSSVLPKKSLRATTGTDAENSIDRIKVLVFSQQGSTYFYDYMVDGQEITPNSGTNTTTFTALLTASDQPLKLILVGNYNDAFLHHGPTRGQSEEEVRTALADTFQEVLTEDLPMYGEAELTQLKTDQYNNIAITMLRAVARVEVVDDIDTQFSAPFSMQEVYIFRPNNALRLIPDASAMSGAGTPVTVASIPSGSAREGFLQYALDAGTDPVQATGMYVSESSPVTSSLSDQILTATCVVVGGYYNDDTELSYYRIDFDSGLEGHPFGQILRNYRYIFNIKQVNLRGWETPEDAANNEPSSIVATMQLWNEVTSEMYFSTNDNYLGISSRKIVLDYMEGAKDTVYLQTTVPFTIQPTTEDGKLIGSPIHADGETFVNDFFRLKIEKGESNGKDIYRLLITSLTENRTADSFFGYFQVFTDFWTFDVEVEQLCYKSYYDGQMMRILTVTSLHGDLGTTNGTTTDISGAACRKILDNPANFSPQGVIPISGVVVYDILNSTISSSSSETLYILSKLLEEVDVVHLPAKCTPSEEAAQLINTWVRANINRVLILGMDDARTNATIRKYFTEDGMWYEAFPEDRQESVIYATGTVFEEPGDEAFRLGPFGEVPLGINIGYTDGAMSYNDGYNAETTTPILRATDGTDANWMMTHGVNKELGLIYLGDSKITTSEGDALSQEALSTGTITSTMDILMGNIWAWVAERVFATKEIKLNW